MVSEGTEKNRNYRESGHKHSRKEGEFNEPLQRPRQSWKLFSLLPLFHEAVLPEGRGTYLELVVGNHVEEHSNAEVAEQGQMRLAGMTGPWGMKGISWCSVGHFHEKAALWGERQTLKIYRTTFGKREGAGLGCCLVPECWAW